jgi:glycosyltransferase involved in cell wall biosynthesis
MKILYHCPEYYYRHGGRTHARGFFSALKKLSAVSQAFLHPKDDPQAAQHGAEQPIAGRGKLWFLPPTLRQVIQFFVPRSSLTTALIDEIKLNGIDALVVRTGVRQPSLGRIKSVCPDTTICLEVNSAYFDEALPGLPLRSVFQQWEVRRFRSADAIVVVSTYLKDYLEKRGLHPDKIIVNHNGVDVQAMDIAHVSDVRDQYHIPRSAFVIGYVGGMETFRRLPEVIGYIAKLRSLCGNDIYFMIVGDGDDMSAVRAAVDAERGALGDAVKLLGWRDHAEIPRFLATFDIAIFPFTNAYCSPLKLFEYLAAGVPSIGPDTPAVREVFGDGTHLKLVKQDGTNFVDTIIEMKENPELRERLRDCGRELILDRYTWEKNAERVVEHIHNVRNAGKRRCG